MTRPGRLLASTAAASTAAASTAAGLALAAAILLPIAHVSTTLAHDPLARAPQGDEKTFATWAHKVATRTDDAIPYQAPLYPTALGALERAGLDPLVAGRVANVLLAFVAAAIAARLALDATRDRRAALVAFVLTALARPLVHSEGTLLRETASAALVATTALALARARSQNERPFGPHLGLGLALGIGLVLRENFTVLTAAVGLERLVALRRAPARAAAVLGLIAGIALPLLPFDVKVTRLDGGVHALPNWNPGCVFFLANRRDNATDGGYQAPAFVPRGNPEGEVEGFTTEAERRAGHALSPHAVGSYWLGEGLREVAADPARYARRVANRALFSILPWEMAHQRDPLVDAESSWVLRAPVLVETGALLALALGGALTLIRHRRDATAGRDATVGAVGVVLAAWWLSLLPAAFTSRYRVPAVPLLAVVAALGAREAVRRARRGDRRALLALGVSVALVLFLLPLGRPASNTANARRTRALASLELKRFDDAARDLEESIALAPDVDGYLLLGKSLVEAARAALARHEPPALVHARVARAREAYLVVTAVSGKESRPGAWRELAACELLLDRPRAALAAIERARALGHGSGLEQLESRARSRAARGEDAPPPARSR